MGVMDKNALKSDICALLEKNEMTVAEGIEILEDTKKYLLENCMVAEKKY